jgi:hypothetical protein
MCDEGQAMASVTLGARRLLLEFHRDQRALLGAQSAAKKQLRRIAVGCAL